MPFEFVKTVLQAFRKLTRPLRSFTGGYFFKKPLNTSGNYSTDIIELTYPSGKRLVENSEKLYFFLKETINWVQEGVTIIPAFIDV